MRTILWRRNDLPVRAIIELDNGVWIVGSRKQQTRADGGVRTGFHYVYKEKKVGMIGMEWALPKNKRRAWFL